MASTVESVSDERDCTGAEHYLVGLNPGYWSHVPLLIHQILNLSLVDGVNCIIVDDGHVIPVSRCHIVGTVVAVERRSNGSILYAIDDGSGLVDVLKWEDQDLFQLPALTSAPQGTDGISIGTVVSIHGRIECVAVGEQAVMQGLHSTRSTIKEIHATLVEPIHASPAATTSLDTETLHWKRCSEFLSSPNLHAKDVLEALGPEVRGQVSRRENFPASNDTAGEWRVFGTNCKCSVAYKYSLLYCHCQATRKTIDSGFEFRDALLKYLLKLESELKGTDPLRFLYHTVMTNEPLQSIACKVCSSNDITAVKRLFQNTFKTLSDDGIIYLLDSDSDTYVLLSRSRVLEPYTHKILTKDVEGAEERMNLLKHRPQYLDKIPKSRLQYLKRLLLLQAKGRNS